MTYRISLQSLSHHKLSKATSCCQIFFPSLDFCDKNLFVTVHAGAQYVLNTPAIAFSLSFSVSYHKLFKATFHCQLCFHDWYFYRPQRLITNCSRLFPLSDLFLFSSSMRQKNQFVTHHEGAQYVLNIHSNCIIFYRFQCLTTNCSRLLLTVRFAPMTYRISPQFHWLFKATFRGQICLPSLDPCNKNKFITDHESPVCAEHSQQLHCLGSFSVSHHKLFKPTFYCQICFLSRDSCDKQLVTDHEGDQYVLNIPSNCIIFHRSRCRTTNCSRPLSSVSCAPMTVISTVLSASSQIVQCYFPLSDVLSLARVVR